MLTLMYIAFAVVGCAYVLLSAFLGHLGPEHVGHVHDHAAGTADAHGHPQSGGERYGLDGKGHGTASAGGGAPVFHFPFFSPLALATLIAAVGGFGLIAQHGFGAGEGVSLLVALPAAVATAYAVTYAGWRLATGSRASSVIRLERLTGAPAEVSVPIPAGGIGEAVAFVDGQRYAAPARAADGGAVARGTPVTVVEMVGTTLVVRAGTNPRPIAQEGSSTV